MKNKYLNEKFLLGFSKLFKTFLHFSKVLLGRRQRWAQAEELRSSFFSNEHISDAYEPQGFGGFMGYRRFRRPLPLVARRSAVGDRR